MNQQNESAVLVRRLLTVWNTFPEDQGDLLLSVGQHLAGVGADVARQVG